VRYEVFTAELLKIQSFWFVTMCLLVNSYQPFQRLQYLQNVWNYLPIIMVKHPRRPGSPLLILCFTQKLSCNSCLQDVSGMAVQITEHKKEKCTTREKLKHTYVKQNTLDSFTDKRTS